MRDIAHFKYAL